MLLFQNEGEKNSICKKDDKKTLGYKKSFYFKTKEKKLERENF